MKFQPGHVGGPGRRPGVRNRLSNAFLEDLLADWREHGANAIRVMRAEDPVSYVRVVAGILPRELIFEDATSGMTVEELDAVLVEIRRQLEAPQEAPMLIEARVIN